MDKTANLGKTITSKAKGRFCWKQKARLSIWFHFTQSMAPQRLGDAARMSSQGHQSFGQWPLGLQRCCKRSKWAVTISYPPLQTGSPAALPLCDAPREQRTILHEHRSLPPSQKKVCAKLPT